MTKKSLILSVVAVCALPAASQAQVLINENFDSLGTTSAGFSGPVGPDFTGANVQISGTACRIPASGHCLVLQNGLGVLTSKTVMLDPGVRYVLSFDLVGNGATGAATTSVTTVKLGPAGSLFDHVYTLNNGSPTSATEVTQTLTVTMPETVDLVFMGTGVSRTAGMVVDNVRLSGAPEPATLGLLALGLLGSAGAGFARRKRRN